jgi:hypothetical protein
VRVVADHAEALLQVTRRDTGCAADAKDAYQRALEVFCTRAPRLDAETAYTWLFNVVEHEALAVREQRARLLGVEDEQALDRLEDGRHLQTVEERSEGFEEMLRAAEALKRCKPQEVTALVLKAAGALLPGDRRAPGVDVHERLLSSRPTTGVPLRASRRCSSARKAVAGDLCCDKEAAREAAERELEPKQLRGEHYDLPVDVSVYAWAAAPCRSLAASPRRSITWLDESRAAHVRPSTDLKLP